MPFKPRTFVKPQLMQWNTNKITDHNRAELGVGNERIEQAKRMANGRMRKYVVADKRTFSTSWADVPQSSSFTVDGFWGAKQMETFYYATPGSFDLKLAYGDGTTETIKVMFSSFSSSISKRGAYDFWQVNVEMIEV